MLQLKIKIKIKEKEKKKEGGMWRTLMGMKRSGGGRSMKTEEGVEKKRKIKMGA
jgi:hypothetical protein